MAWDKLDLIFKKFLGKRITHKGKKHYEEFSDASFELYASEVRSEEIDQNPSQAVSDGVAVHHEYLELTRDNTVSDFQAYYASSGGNKISSWISDRFGAGYKIRLFDNNNVEIFPTSTIDWLFDHVTGYLIIDGDVSGYAKPFKITGYQYVGGDLSSIPAKNMAFDNSTANLPNNPTNIEQAINELALNANVVQSTYNDLLTKKSDGSLVPGRWYEFERSTKFRIMNADGSITTADPENLLILAISNNEFHTRVVSREYPLDIIEYDIDTQHTWDSVDIEGDIIYRKDDRGNIDRFDHRSYLVRRYQNPDTYKYTEVTDNGEPYIDVPIFGPNSYNNVIGMPDDISNSRKFHNNTIRDDCRHNIIGGMSENCTIDSSSYRNEIGPECDYVVVAGYGYAGARDNRIGGNCSFIDCIGTNNIFESSCGWIEGISFNFCYFGQGITNKTFTNGISGVRFILPSTSVREYHQVPSDVVIDKIFDDEYYFSTIDSSGTPTYEQLEYKPAAPTGVTVTENSDDIDVSWVDNSNNEDVFEIHRSEDDASYTVIDTVSADTTTYKDLSVPAGTYYYKVRAVSAAGINSDFSNTENITKS